MMAWKLLTHALVITTFVAVMMVGIEWFNVQTRGTWSALVGRRRWQGLLVGALLGAIPGCLGAFALVSLYGARKVTLGAVVAGMIATSGDETFVMLATIPQEAVAITVGLALLGVVAGALTDVLFPGETASCCEHGFTVHTEERCRCWDVHRWVAGWRNPSPHRVLLAAFAVLLLVGLALGQLGPPAWDWERITLMLVVGFGLFVVSTTPDHFVNEHLWRHVARKHVPRILAWTLAALVAVKLLEQVVDVEALIASNPWATLAVAGLVGIVPESGPHLVFVTLYDQGSLPLGILVASSAVQDGHGMLPLLAQSRVDFLKVKAVNLVVGMAVGGAMLLLGS